ncbi:hypothetical protein BDY19DRAFT_993119 [Irpex rosettiformis]|uniref:Uncharacterized protein n=1 Tax=Irpex rosettiformis TaxID=378272 RepID=A0ACB8U557_9APHY|nr:hypothetical protein BDY19DRAFT_993119 [Irpex rosettiformis]
MLSNTPVKFKAAHTTSAISNNVEDGRNAIMTDIDLKVPLVPLSYFKDYLLPPLHDQLDVATVVGKLRQAKAIYDPESEEGSDEIPESRWTLFPDDPAASYDFKEDRVFSPFARLAKAVAKQAKTLFHERGVDPEPEQTVTFLCNPTMTPESTNRHNTSKPDSYGVLVERCVDTDEGKAPHWDDIVVPGEKKKRSRVADSNDNNAKLLWSLHHAMRETVYRRFMFGYTIEDTKMRLWFCNRSNIIVSDTFNFITSVVPPSQNHETLVHFFLSIMFADRSKLGYDPTIAVSKRTKDQRTTKYNIMVRGHDGHEATYITDEVVANISAEALQGRATRVWREKKADENGRSAGHNMVIKDCWIDDDRQREGDVFAEILEAAKASSNPEHLENIERHFLKVVQHGDVFIDGEKDDTFKLARRGAEFPEPRQFLELHCSSEPKEVIKPPIGLVTVDQATVNWLNTLRYDNKSHYRIVFDSEEDCDPIDTLTSGRAIWYAMGGALTGIATLHVLGFIHRDISAGNVLVGRGISGSVKGGTGKIVDLEFCKRIDDNRPVHQGRTGTRYFIPIEVENGTYMFGPTLPQTTADPKLNFSQISKLMEDDDDDSLSESSETSDTDSSGSTSTVKAPPFVNNPLHDLESIWWLAVYLFLSRPVVEKQVTKGKAHGEVVKEEDNQGEGERSTATSTTTHPPLELRAMQLLVDYKARTATLMNPTGFSEHTKGVHKHLVSIMADLGKALTWLVNAYITAEASLYTSGVNVKGVLGDIHSQLSALFVKIFKKTSRHLEFQPTHTSFVRPPTITVSSNPGFSLDSKLAPPRTRKHHRDEADDNDGKTSVSRITTRMEALQSPTRAETSRDSKRARYDEEHEDSLEDAAEEESARLPALRLV